FESFGLVVLEALACGTPVVGFKVGAVPDLVRHRETGYIAPVGDVPELAAGLRWLMSLPAAERMTQRAKATASLPADTRIEQQCENYLAVYRDVSAMWDAAQGVPA